MASIIWIDLDGYRHESNEHSKYFTLYHELVSFGKRVSVVEELDCKGLTTLYSPNCITGLFGKCPNLREVRHVRNSYGVTRTCYMFEDCTNLVKVPYFNTSNVKDMSGMFMGCKSLTSVPKYKTSQVTCMDAMFAGCSNLKCVPCFDISNIEDMSEMFYDCSNLKSVPLLASTNVKNVNLMFKGCSSLFPQTFKDRIGIVWLYNFYKSLNDKCEGKDALIW